MADKTTTNDDREILVAASDSVRIMLEQEKHNLENLSQELSVALLAVTFHIGSINNDLARLASARTDQVDYSTASSVSPGDIESIADVER